MRVTTNIYRSATCVLELFKFVTSLALVTAVSVWLGVVGLPSTSAPFPTTDHTLAFVAFALLLVRYYHGNSLHLMDRYAEGTPARRLDVALPADSFFILSQGVVLVALSFTIRDSLLFYWLLLALVSTDAIWAGSLARLNQEPTDSYLKTWFLINFVGAILLIAMRLAIGNAAAALPIGCFCFILVHTVLDYLWNWQRYFPAPDEQSLMIGAPLTAKIVDGRWSDMEMMECIFRVFHLCQQNGYAVYSAHVIEQFGAKLRKLSNYVLADVREAKDSAVYVGITDGTLSNGLAVELGIAAACGTQIILFVRESSKHITFLEELVLAHEGCVMPYSTPDDLIEKISKKLKLKKGQDSEEVLRTVLAAQHLQAVLPVSNG